MIIRNINIIVFAEKVSSYTNTIEYLFSFITPSLCYLHKKLEKNINSGIIYLIDNYFY